MKDTRFRAILVAVGAVLIIGVLFGCSQSSSPATSSPPTSAPPSTSAAPSTSTAPSSSSSAAASPAANKPAGPSIKIGWMNPLTGVFSDFGKRGRIMTQIAVKQINDAGGINGVPIQVVYEDTQSDVQQTIRLMQKFASDDKVLAVVGPFQSPATTVSFPFAVKAKMPVITMSPFMPGVAEQVRPYGYSFNLPDSDLIAPTIKAYIKMYGVKKTAVVEQVDQDYVKGLGDQLGAAMKQAGLDVVNLSNPIGITGDQTDFAAAVTKLKGLNVDGVAVALTGRQAGPFVAEMRRQGLTIPVVGANTLTEAGYQATGGKAVEGTVSGSMFWSENPDPTQRSVAAAFEAVTKKENPDNPLLDSFASINWEAFQAFAQVMRQGGIKNTPASLASDRDIINKGIANLKDFQGIGGKMSMGPNGVIQRPIFILVMKNGKWQRVQQ